VPTSVPTVRPALADDVRPLSQSLARAFYDDPIMSHIVPDETKRRNRLWKLFDVVAKVDMDKGGVWTTPGREGAALWAAPGKWRDSPRHLVRQMPLVFTIGRDLPRAMRLFTMMDKHHPREPHWYLGVLGTDPAHQGKGLGSALLRPVLDRCDDEGVPAYLESSKESNVPFYERHGFRVMHELPIPGGPTLWPMWRDPRPPED
jgi:GNAT superfamily N-acetyltransferase